MNDVALSLSAQVVFLVLVLILLQRFESSGFKMFSLKTREIQNKQKARVQTQQHCLCVSPKETTSSGFGSINSLHVAF